MSKILLVSIYEKQKAVRSQLSCVVPLEIGRQQPGETLLTPSPSSESGCQTRIALVSQDNQSVSRRHAVLDLSDNGSIRIRNLSKVRPIVLEGVGAGVVDVNETSEHAPPVRLRFGDLTIELRPRGSALSPSPTLETRSGAEAGATLAPGGESLRARFATANWADLPEWQADLFANSLQTAVSVLQSAVSSDDCLTEAARAVVELVGLENCWILIREGEGWRTAAHARTVEALPLARAPSNWVLSQVSEQRRTYWLSPTRDPVEAESMANVQAVVAAPILNAEGSVIGVVYADRSAFGLAEKERRMTRIEARLAEIIAYGVSASLDRLSKEQELLEQASELIRERGRFEQFFTPELSRELTKHPKLLEGRTCDVTVLFCDIRNFSAISEQIGPERTVEWISAVMEALSACVREYDGVLVDYIGDELLAMWGAPMEQPDHPRLACLAALGMLDALPALNDRWGPLLGAPTDIGIGVNSGSARVGNIGSKSYKFKYGPLGNTVNVASRTQGATKHLRSRLLITGATRDRLIADEPNSAAPHSEFATRKLCEVRMVHIHEPVALYELAQPNVPVWQDLKERFEEGLRLFDERDFDSAGGVLGRLLIDHRDDGPTRVLLKRAVNAMVDGPEPGHPVWQLPGK